MLTFTGLYWLGSLSPGDQRHRRVRRRHGVRCRQDVSSRRRCWGSPSEQLPRGGALLMSIMGGCRHARQRPSRCPMMGARIDALGAGAALQMMSLAPATFPAVLFVGLWFYYRSRGEHRPSGWAEDTDGSSNFKVVSSKL